MSKKTKEDITLSFRRVETKYLTDRKTAALFLESVLPYMHPDEFGKSNVRSLYYDSPDYELIRRSCDKPFFKEKIRSRCYGDYSKAKVVFLEIKRKTGSVGTKRRVALPPAVLEDYIKTGKYPEQYDSQMLREIEYLCSDFKIEPKVLISVDREAYFSDDDPDFRISFDTNIMYQHENPTLGDGFEKMHRLIPEDMCMIELKSPLRYEKFAADALDKLKIYQTSFSKYGTVYQTEIAKNLNKYMENILI